MFMIILQDRVIGSKNNIDEAVKLAKSTALDSGMETTVVKAQKTVQIQAVVFDLEEPKVEVNHPVKSVEEALDKMPVIIENSQGDVNIVLTPEIEGQTNILDLDVQKTEEHEDENPITATINTITDMENMETLNDFVTKLTKDSPNVALDTAVKQVIKEKRAFLDKQIKTALEKSADSAKQKAIEFGKILADLMDTKTIDELIAFDSKVPEEHRTRREYQDYFDKQAKYFQSTPQKEKITESNFVDLNITIARKYGDCYTIDQLNVERDFFINKYENISELAWFKEMYHAQVRVIDKNRKK